MCDKPSWNSCLKFFNTKNWCKWPPSYDTTAMVSAPEVLRSDSPGGCHANIEVQHEANAIHQAELKLTEQLAMASEVTPNIAQETSTWETHILHLMEILSY